MAAIRDLSARDRITRARSALIQSQPFFGVLALHSELVELPSIETMAVDGARLFYAPEFVTGLSEPELIGVLAHEMLHLALLHHTRRGGRDPEDWNEACDYAINGPLLAQGFTLPRGRLHAAEFEGQGAESIYATLRGRKASPQGQPQPQAPQGQDKGQDGNAGQGPGQGQQPGQDAGQPGQGQPQPGQGQGQGQPAGAAPDRAGCGGVIDAAPDAGGNAAAAAETEAVVRQAIAVAAAGAGEIPGALARILAELNRPRVDWRESLGRFIDDAAVRVTSWNRPDKRFLGSGFYMPGRERDSVSDVVVFRDTSGSVNDDALRALTSEAQGILDTGRVERVHVVDVDSAVRGFACFDAGDVIELESKGGGGTRFDVAWEWLAAHVPDPAAVVYLTDLDSRHFGTDPGCPVLWAVTGRRTAAPFGEVIPLDPYS